MDYAALRDGTAKKLFAKYGFKAAVMEKSASESFDPIAGIVTNTQWVAHPCYALYGGGRSGRYPGVQYDRETGNLVRKTTEDIYLDASTLDITPTPDHRFRDENGAIREIVGSQAINPGGVVVLWRATVKK
jgi:hypothetical protein